MKRKLTKAESLLNDVVLPLNLLFRFQTPVCFKTGSVDTSQGEVLIIIIIIIIIIN